MCDYKQLNTKSGLVARKVHRLIRRCGIVYRAQPPPFGTGRTHTATIRVLQFCPTGSVLPGFPVTHSFTIFQFFFHSIKWYEY